MKQQFKEMRKLLEMQWTQGAFARDANGTSVCIEDPMAVTFCLEGAMAKVTNDQDMLPYLENAIYDMNPRDSHRLGKLFLHVPTWNDQPKRTRQQVLAVVDRCIEMVG